MANPYTRIYEDQEGGALPYFTGVPVQRGGSFFGRVFRAVAQFVRPHLSYLGKKALSGAVSTGQDLLEGKSFKEAAKSNLKRVGKDMAKEGLERLAQMGQGLRRRRRRRQKKSLSLISLGGVTKRRRRTSKKRKKSIKGRKKTTTKRKRKRSKRRLKVTDPALIKLARLNLS